MTVRYDTARRHYYRFSYQKKSYFHQGFETKREADLAEISRKAALASGKTEPSRNLMSMKFGEAAQVFIDKYVPDLEHRNDYYQRLPLVCDKLRGRLFLKTTAGEIKDALRAIMAERKWSKRTYNHTVSHVRRIYAWWEEKEKYDVLGEDTNFTIPNPANRVETFDIADGEVHHMSVKEREIMNRAVKADGRIWPHYRIALHMGLREANICHIRVKDVNWNEWTISLVVKGKKRGSLPIPAELHNDFLSWAANKAPEDFLVGLHPNTVSRIFTELARANGAGLATFHWLRHTFAFVLLKEKGVSLYEVSKLLHHSTYRVTEKVYGKYAAKELEDAVNKTSGITGNIPLVMEAI